VIHVLLRGSSESPPEERTLLADTGAGRRRAAFGVVLSVEDRLRHASWAGSSAKLGGAVTGWFSLYPVMLEVPELEFARRASAVAVPAALLPSGLDGIAGFAFLNQFTYGNCGDPDRFGLETLTA